VSPQPKSRAFFARDLGRGLGGKRLEWEEVGKGTASAVPKEQELKAALAAEVG
jgi:hypothetical protein